MELVMTSSNISPIKAGQKIMGTVKDDPNSYKIYELYVNSLQYQQYLSSNNAVDLFIMLTPCTGNLEFFITDDYKKLFTEETLM